MQYRRMLEHALITLAVQLASAVAFRNWWVGGLLMSGFYAGREFTQAEYRWISQFGEGRRANMPWWGGLDPQVWNFKSFGDVLGSVIAALLVWAIAAAMRRRHRD